MICVHEGADDRSLAIGGVKSRKFRSGKIENILFCVYDCTLPIKRVLFMI